jgi:hypothetical protein
MTLQQILNEALNDEYKARAQYRKVIDKFGPVRPFINIVASEERHIAALLPLFRRYGIPVPEDNWAKRVTVPGTLQEACRIGVEAEIENMTMYDRLLAKTQKADVARVLAHLQAASRENHLPAFQRCAGLSAVYRPIASRGQGRRHRKGWQGC